MENGVIQGGRVVCYTCVTGGYDSVRGPAYVTPGVDYVCFSDRPFPGDAEVWKF